jgi:hypothetical protein
MQIRIEVPGESRQIATRPGKYRTRKLEKE